MQNLNQAKTALVLSLAALSAAVVAPASASTFFDAGNNFRASLGSAPNPTPHDLRGDYPAASRAMNEHGRVGLRMSLTGRGSVTSAVVERSSGIRRLDDAAIKYVMSNWLYQPANGEMPREIRVVVDFRLR